MNFAYSFPGPFVEGMVTAEGAPLLPLELVLGKIRLALAFGAIRGAKTVGSLERRSDAIFASLMAASISCV